VTPFYVAMQSKELSLGMIYLDSGPEMLGTLAQAGFNHVVLDHRFTRYDWGTTVDVMAHARLAGLSPLIRVETYPSVGRSSTDVSAVAKVARARMTGAHGAMVAIGSVAQIQECMHVSDDVEHTPVVSRTMMADSFAKGGWEAVSDLAPPEIRRFPIVPVIEDIRLLPHLDELVAVPGLMAICLGIHHICVSLGRPFDVEHPEVWDVIDRVVGLARPRGISVWTNTGFKFVRAAETADRIERLYKHGIDTIQVQTPEQFLLPVLSDICSLAERQIAATSRPLSPRD
jgi:2-keto-3-deoxy-L-rhamnonate aldolase RhmA